MHRVAKYFLVFLSVVMVSSIAVYLIAVEGYCRGTLRDLINHVGSNKSEKPEVYHEYEGYSPGAKRSQGVEDFSRYHYYIAPTEDELLNSDPEIYFRQDYEPIESQESFDEEKYWREHPLFVDEPLPEAADVVKP